MSRQARKRSSSGIYHIMLRGVNQQQIFEDKEDNEYFLQVLKKCKAISDFKLFAYCLMGNHIHLLIQEGLEPVEQIMKRIAGRFVYWYNIKYQRTGHLFQDRFKSEPVEDDAYFLTVLRYIHQNPIVAHICKKIEDYEYSSYNDFLKDTDLIDTEFVFGIIPKEDFAIFNKEKTKADCIDIDNKVVTKVTDQQAKKIIEKISKCKNVSEFQLLEGNVRDRYLKRLRESGLSIRQISRLTGVSFNVVRRF